MLRRLVAFLLGYLRVEVSGPRIERFLNLALAEQISLWGIERLPDRMRVTMTVADFRRLRPVARGSQSRIRLRGRHGLPFVLARLRRRPVLAAGAVACVAFVVWYSAHVWVVQIKVTGPQNLDPRAVEAVAAEAGVRVGAWKSRIDKEAVQQHIQKRMSEISWAVVRIQGTRVVIEVVEKAVQKPANQASCVHLVARKSGVIEQVIPFQGEPLVKKGDIVRAGDMLVECVLRYWSGGRPSLLPGAPLPPRESIARLTVAQARVRARITYQEYREVPLYREVPTPTGRKVTQWVLTWRNRPILKIGPKAIPFSRYEERRKVNNPLVWRKWKSPVELVSLTSEEVTVRRERIPLHERVAEARQQMAAQLRWVLGPSDQLLSPLKVEVVEQAKDYAGLRITVETLEDIAAPREGSG